jgi:radical SAM protein with 4Fe4S-binding SPASM domain
VSAEGDLYPCPGVIFDRFKVGNVFETPLGDLLASPAMARMRNLRKADTSGPCATCPNDACSGGCRGASYAAFGDENHAPPFCTVYRP